MVGIAGPSGGRFCPETYKGAAAASKSGKNSRKLLLIPLCFTISSPLFSSTQAIESQHWETPNENFWSGPKLCTEHYVLLLAASTSIRFGGRGAAAIDLPFIEFSLAVNVPVLRSVRTSARTYRPHVQ